MGWIIVPIMLFAVACLVWYLIGKWDFIDLDSLYMEDEDELDLS